MNVKRSAYLAAALILMLACAREETEVVTVPEAQRLTIKASVDPGNPDSKTLRNEENGDVLWTPDDKISLFYGSGTDGGSCFESLSAGNSTSADFEGSIVLDGEGKYFWGLYPYADDNECDGSSVTMTLPDRQAAVSGSFAPGTFLSVGRSTGTNMVFYNVCGGMRIKLSKAGVKKIVFRSFDGPVAGRAKIVLNSNGIPEVESIIEGKNEIVLEAPEGSYLETGKNYYFTIFPHEFSGNYFSLTFETDTEIGTYERTRSFTITRSVIEGFSAAVDSRTEYKTITGRIRNRQEFISFIESQAAGAGTDDIYILEADIDLSGWTASPAASFAGTFEGSGHTISGLQSGVPFFTNLSGTVRDLTIDGSCSFTPSCNTFGIIAGSSEGIISNVTNKAPVSLNGESLTSSVLVAAIAGSSTGSISCCTNEGPISVAMSGAVKAVGVAGIVAYDTAAVDNCVNKGAISFSAAYISAKSAVIDISSTVPSIGGVVAYGGTEGLTVTGCHNYGTVNYSLNAADNSTSNMNRHQIGGIVGSPSGTVSNCVNHSGGKITVSITSSTPGTAIPYEYIANVGGIGGGDYLCTTKGVCNSRTSYIDCVNEADIELYSDASQTNTAIGGIVGWPGQEAADVSTEVRNCVNQGNITVSGPVKCRIGGIEGGSGVVRSSSSSGTITVLSCDPASSFGGIGGFRHYGHAMTDCEFSGSIVVNAQVVGGVGGLVGKFGTYQTASYLGCSVTGSISATYYNPGYMGLVVGLFGDSATKVITVGSPESPVHVSAASLPGSQATLDKLCGTANASYDHTIYSDLGENHQGCEPFIIDDDSMLETLTDSSINGTAINSNSDVAGVIVNTSTGAGIAGVPVTDGYSFALTDANGVYQMKRDPRSRKVYYTLPAEYELNMSSYHYPDFYSPGIMTDGQKYRVDFSLTPRTVANNFAFIMIGDPQCYRASEANRYVNETIADIKTVAANYSEVYAMTLGDITFDSTSLWETMKNTMADVQLSDGRYLPFFQTIGNHDHDSLMDDTSDDDDDDYRAVLQYVKTFGPENYSFDRGNVHVVVMDNIIVHTKKTSGKPNNYTWEYDGGLTDDQWAWLQADIANVSDKQNKMVFFCAHIPFRWGGSTGGATVYRNYHYNDVLNCLKGFKEAHLMIGHTHYQQNYVHSKICSGGLPVYEHIHGAACGAWWQSNCSSTTSGEPSGYTVYEIEGAHIKDWKFKGTRRDEDFQLRVFDGDDIYYASKSYPLNWFTVSQAAGSASISVLGNVNCQGALVAQVFDDDDTYWTVKLYRKSTGAEIGTFTRIPDGECANIAIVSYWFNVKNKNTDSWSKRTASHYWYYKPASGSPSDMTDWEVRAVHTLPGGTASHTFTCSSITREANFSKEFYFGQ